MDICSCKTRVPMAQFDSIDPAVYQIMSPKVFITDNNETLADPPLPALDIANETISSDASANSTAPSGSVVPAGTTGPAETCPPCDTNNQYCNTETKKCEAKHNDGDQCSVDANCFHVCMNGKCQAEKAVGESCTDMKECTHHNAYCDTTAKQCKYKHEKDMVCTNNMQVVHGHYCHGGYVYEYKVEGEACSTENKCDPERKLTCTNDVCKAEGSQNSFLEVVAAPLLDAAFRPEICVSQALNYTKAAVRNAVQTHNRYVEKYKVLMQNVDDMRKIAKIFSSEVLPEMNLPTLKAVDEVFDDTLMHKTMLAESETQSWVVTPKDYFHDFKRYYKFKPVGKTQQVELTFETVDLECKYNHVQYFESSDCDDDAAKEALFKADSPRVCNTVQPGGGKFYPYTQGPVQLHGKCIYVKLYSDLLVKGNSYEMHTEVRKNLKGVIANYKSSN